jgi:Cu+-exporting ATPase
MFMSATQESGSLDDGRITFDRPKESTEAKVRDPVCGMAVTAATAAGTSVYRDETYSFCSLSCKGQFDADPARYAGS